VLSLQLGEVLGPPVSLIHASSGGVLVAAAASTVEVWHMSASAAEITRRAWQGDATPPPPTYPLALLGAPEVDGIGKDEPVRGPARAGWTAYRR
jgi:hypothetical protein